MRQTTHTYIAYKILNNRPLRQVAHWQQSLLIYVGKDDHYLLLNHSKEMVDELDQLEQGLLEMKDVRGPNVRVKFMFMADGAGVVPCFVSSAASKHPMCYNAMQQSDVANLKLFGPIDRRAES